MEAIGGEHAGQVIAQGLHPVESAVAADADQPLDAELFQSVHNLIQLGVVVRIHEIARRANQRAALGRVHLRDFLEQRVEVDVGDALIEEAIEPFDEADDLDAQRAGADDGAMDGGVERGRVAAGGEDGDASHVRAPEAGFTAFGPSRRGSMPSEF